MTSSFWRADSQSCGATIGGVVDAASGGATGGLGTVIGSLIGGVLGNALDELVEALGVLTPLFDAVAVIMDAMSPILLALKDVFFGVGLVLVGFAPLIHALAQPIGELITTFAMGLLTLAPFLQLGLAIVGGIAEIALSVVLLTPLFSLLNDAWELGLLRMYHVLNGFVDLYNHIIDLIRFLPGMEKFGSKLDHLELDRTIIDPDSESTDALEDNTDALREFNRALTNVPSWYKVQGAEFDAIDGRGEHGVGRP